MAEFFIPKLEVINRAKANPYTQLRSCLLCGLYKNCRTPFMQGQMDGTGKPRIMVIGGKPDESEDLRGKPFVGRAGSFFRSCLRSVEIDEKVVHFTNVVACRPPSNDLKPYPKAVKYCHRGVLQEIQDVDPDIVVLAGNLALKTVLGIDKVTHWSGEAILSSAVPELHIKPFKFEDGRQRIYVPMTDPISVLMTRGTEFERPTLDRYIKDMKALGDIVKHGVTARKLPPHRVIGWDAIAEQQKVRDLAKRITDLAEAIRSADNDESKLAAEGEKSAAERDLALCLHRFAQLRDEAFEEAVKYIKALNDYERVIYDWETPDLDPYQDYSRILCAGFAPLLRRPGVPEFGTEYPWIPPEQGTCIPLDHPDSPFTREQLGVLLHLIREWLINPKSRKVAHNAPFETLVASQVLGVEPETEMAFGLECTLHSVFTTNEMPGTHGLKYNARKYTEFGGYERDNEKAVKQCKGRFDNIRGVILFPYNAMDAMVTVLAEMGFYAKIATDEQWPLLNRILFPAVRFLSRMEQQGISVNQTEVRRLTDDFNRRITETKEQAASFDEIRRVQVILRWSVSEKLKEKEKLEAFDKLKAEFKTALAAYNELKERWVPPEKKALDVTSAEFRAAFVDLKGMQANPLASPKELKIREKAVKALGQKVIKLRAAKPRKNTELSQMEKKLNSLAKKAQKSQERLGMLGDKIEKQSTFSLGKNDHIRVLLYDILRLPIIMRTKTGLPSVGDEVLEKFKTRHPAVRLVSAYRKLTKIRSTYLIPLHPDLEVHKGITVVKPDGKVHPNMKATAETGRLKSGSKGRGKSEEASKKFKFNIQNLPRPFKLFDPEYPCKLHKAHGAQPLCADCGITISIRSVFQTSHPCAAHAPNAKKGCGDCGRIIEGDYKGLEFAMGGIISKDKSVLDCIKVQQEIDHLVTAIENLEIQNNACKAPADWEAQIKVIKAEIGNRAARADFHRRSAAGALNINPEDVTDKDRQRIKSAISFGLYYLRAAPALAADMGWTLEEAQAFSDGFWETYKGVKERHLAEIEFARKHGYVKTITGRRRRLPAILSQDRGKRGHAERQAVNTGIQGPCSDFTLLSGIALDIAYRSKGMKARVIALVHDAVYTDAPASEVLEAARMTKEIMEEIPLTFTEMIAPLFVERKVGVSMGKG